MGQMSCSRLDCVLLVHSTEVGSLVATLDNVTQQQPSRSLVTGLCVRALASV